MNKLREFSKTKCVNHLIRSGIENCYDAKIINSIMVDKYLLLWCMMKEGDLVEDLSTSGYRSQGRYIVKLNSEGNLYVDDLCTDYDDYGSIPPEFTTITKFPIGYFDDVVINDGFHVGEEAKSYWHIDKSYVFLDLPLLGLNKLTYDDVKIKKYDDEYYVHTVVEYNTDKYLLLWKTSREYGPKPFTTEKLKDKFIEMLDNNILEPDTNDVTDGLLNILDRYDIDQENVLTIC